MLCYSDECYCKVCIIGRLNVCSETQKWYVVRKKGYLAFAAFNTNLLKLTVTYIIFVITKGVSMGVS